MPPSTMRGLAADENFDSNKTVGSLGLNIGSLGMEVGSIVEGFRVLMKNH